MHIYTVLLTEKVRKAQNSFLFSSLSLLSLIDDVFFHPYQLNQVVCHYRSSIKSINNSKSAVSFIQRKHWPFPVRWSTQSGQIACLLSPTEKSRDGSWVVSPHNFLHAICCYLLKRIYSNRNNYGIIIITPSKWTQFSEMYKTHFRFPYKLKLTEMLSLNLFI